MFECLKLINVYRKLYNLFDLRLNNADFVIH